MESYSGRQVALFVTICVIALATYYAIFATSSSSNRTEHFRNFTGIPHLFTGASHILTRASQLGHQIFGGMWQRKAYIVDSLTTSRLLKSQTTAEKPDCKAGPKKNLLFLKTHKTGGTTIQNMFLRYAWANNLFVGMPKKYNNFGFDEGFSKRLMQSVPRNKIVNMLIHHMLFDHEQVASVLPTDSVYLTVLRDPATRLQSSFNYFKIPTFLEARRVGGFEELVLHPTKYFHQLSKMPWFLKNHMSYDLGFDYLNDTAEYQRETLEEMDEIFDLVMITEHLDISLLLLKDLLCWNISDVVYLSMNVRKVSTVIHLSADIKEKIYDWNKLDTALYRHYNRTLWRRVEKYGRTRLENDLKELVNLKLEIANFCLEKELVASLGLKDKRFKMENPRTAHFTPYQLNEEAKHNETCKQLILPELQWCDKMNAHQKRT